MAIVTITIATPAVITHTAHAIPEGNMVAFTTDGALPTGIVSGTSYYVHVVTADTYNIATTRANALGGTYIATSGSQSGTHTGMENTGVIDEANSSILDGLGAINLSNVPLPVLVVLTNIVNGSRVRISQTGDNTELSSGTAGSDGRYSFTTYYQGSATIRVRTSSTGTKYLPFETIGIITSDGLNAYVSQVLDTVTL